ncbi:MAG: AMP-dependent synthetase/ligase, partial [Pseudomonadota bacterium]
FFNRIRKAPSEVAFKEYDRTIRQWRSYSWAGLGLEVTRWKSAFGREGLDVGDRVAIMARNCKEWIITEQAAMALEIVVVPIFPHDTPENVAYILNDAGVATLIIDDESTWQRLQEASDQLAILERIIILEPETDENGEIVIQSDDSRLAAARNWLPVEAGPLVERWGDPKQPATIVYTPGTTGRPKGVLLNHVSLLTNARDAARMMAVRHSDQFLSHMSLASLAERICGVYVPMMSGAIIAFARSIRALPRDIPNVVPTMMVTTPQVLNMLNRELEKVFREASPLDRFLYRLALDAGWAQYEVEHKRQSFSLLAFIHPFMKKLVLRNLRPELFGRRLRRVITTGTPLPPKLARNFIGLGIQILQGYHQTEAGGLVALNTMHGNHPESVGYPLDTFHMKIGQGEELMMYGDSIMQYYLGGASSIEAKNKDWLLTGDRLEFKQDHLYMKGRVDNPLELTSGRQAYPELMEMCIVQDPLFLHAAVFGHGQSHVVAVIVIDTRLWAELSQELESDDPKNADINSEAAHQWMVERANELLDGVRRTVPIEYVIPVTDEWTVENGILTPTFKVRRHLVQARYSGALVSAFGGSLPLEGGGEGAGAEDAETDDLGLPGNDEPL